MFCAFKFFIDLLFKILFSRFFVRPEAETTLRLLSNLGGDFNVPDTYVNTPGFNEILADLAPCRLALNCVGGEDVTDMLRILAPGGTLITYGGMSKKPINVPFDLVAYKQLKLRGFWMAEWNNQHSRIDRATMLSDVAQMVRNKELTLFHEMHDFDDFDHALKRSMEPFALRKVLLNMDFPDRMKEHDARPASDYEVFETTMV